MYKLYYINEKYIVFYILAKSKFLNIYLLKLEIHKTVLSLLTSKAIICLLSIFRAFLPNSNANPNVNAKKNINIITNPYIPLVYALTT